MRKHCAPTMSGGVSEKGSPALRRASARDSPTSSTAANENRITPLRSRNAWYSSFSPIAALRCAGQGHGVLKQCTWWIYGHL